MTVYVVLQVSVTDTDSRHQVQLVYLWVPLALPCSRWLTWRLLLILWCPSMTHTCRADYCNTAVAGHRTPRELAVCRPLSTVSSVSATYWKWVSRAPYQHHRYSTVVAVLICADLMMSKHQHLLCRQWQWQSLVFTDSDSVSCADSDRVSCSLTVTVSPVLTVTVSLVHWQWQCLLCWQWLSLVFTVCIVTSHQCCRSLLAATLWSVFKETTKVDNSPAILADEGAIPIVLLVTVMCLFTQLLKLWRCKPVYCSTTLLARAPIFKKKILGKLVSFS